MDAELTYDAEKNEYCVFRGCDLVMTTSSLPAAFNKFKEVCDQVAVRV